MGASAWKPSMKCQKTVPLRMSEVTGKPAAIRTSISRWTVRFVTPNSLGADQACAPESGQKVDELPLPSELIPTWHRRSQF